MSNDDSLDWKIGWSVGYEEALADLPTVDDWVLCERPDLKPHATMMAKYGGCERWGPRCPGKHYAIYKGEQIKEKKR